MRGGLLESWMRRWAWSIAVGVMALASSVRAGVVLLKDGKTIEGSVALVAVGEGRVNVQPAGKAAMSLSLADVKMASLSPRADSPSRECDGVIWTKAQVGNGQRAGTAEINGKSVTIRDSSDGFRFPIVKQQQWRRDAPPPPPTAFCFVFQKLQ